MNEGNDSIYDRNEWKRNDMQQNVMLVATAALNIVLTKQALILK